MPLLNADLLVLIHPVALFMIMDSYGWRQYVKERMGLVELRSGYTSQNIKQRR